jgi:zinc protease
MCFNGTKNFPKDSLLKFLESTGVRFGADINAHTSFDEITYTLTLPTDVPNMLESGMQVLEDWGRWVSFDSIEIEKERGVILEENRQRMANAQGRLTSKQLPEILAGSRYADRMPIGDTNVIKTAPRQAFLDYYYDWFRPELAAVICVGDFKTADIEALVKKHFESWKYQGKGTPKVREKFILPNNGAPIVSIAYDKELPYAGSVAMMIKHPNRDKLSYGNYRETIKESLFETMFNMRLQEIAQEAKPPFLYSAGGMGSFIGDTRVFQLIAIPNAGEFAQGFERGLAEVFRVDQHGFTPTELERAKETILANYEKMFNERDKTENINYANELAGYFEGTESAPGIEVEFELVKKWLPDISIAEVNKMVAEQITAENTVFQVSLQEGGEDKPTRDDILAIYNKALSAKYDAYIDDLGDAKLMKELPKPGKITSTKKLPNYDVTEMKLSNGARVLLKPTDFKNDQILFQCYSSVGSSVYPDAQYQLVDNTPEIIDNNGLGEFSSTKLSKLLQSKMIRISPYVSNYEQGMRGSLTPKDTEIFFQLLNMQFTQPRMDNDAFESWKNKSIEALRSRNNDPMSAFQDTMEAVLMGYSPRSKTVDRDDIEGMTQDAALNIYKEIFADAANFTFVFVGAFKIDDLKPFIEQYIASLPATNKAAKAKDLGIRPAAGQISKIVKRGIEPKSSVMLVIDSDTKDYSTEEIMKINVLREIMTIKLRESLREDKGGVYSPSGTIYMGYFPRKFARAQIYFTCDPNRADELITAAKEVFEIAQSNISQEDLVKAKEIIKKENEVNQKENNYWLRNIVNFETTGRGNAGMTYLKDYSKNIDKLTVKDLTAIAKKYLNYKQNFISIVQMPEDDDE